MNFAMGRDLAQLIIALPALGDTAVTAGGSGDDTDANGVAIDLGDPSRPRAECVSFIAQAHAVLGASATIANIVRVQDSDNGSTGWADIVDPRTPGATFTASKVSAAGAGTNQTDTVISVPTEYCKRYVRLVAKPNMSAANTDTARVQAICILSGLQKL